MTQAWQKRIRALQQKKHRLETGLFLVEGRKNVLELLESGAFVTEALFGTDEFCGQYPQVQVHPAFEGLATAHQLETCGTLQSNDAALAVVRMRPAAGKPAVRGWVLALDDVRDPGNLGTILRIADWYGIGQVWCSPTTADFYNPKVIAASMGSFLRVEAFYGPFEWPPALAVVAAMMDGADARHFAWPSEGILVMGNEANGIRPAHLPTTAQKISIPRYGQAESLNVAIATAVLLDNLRRATS